MWFIVDTSIWIFLNWGPDWCETHCTIIHTIRKTDNWYESISFLRQGKIKKTLKNKYKTDKDKWFGVFHWQQKYRRNSLHVSLV